MIPDNFEQCSRESTSTHSYGVHHENATMNDIVAFANNFTSELQKIQDVLAFQIIDSHTIWYFMISIVLTFVFTSLPRISTARVKIYIVLLVGAAIELTRTLRIDFPKDVSVLQGDIWFTRQCSWTIAAFILAWDAVQNNGVGDDNGKRDHGHTDKETSRDSQPTRPSRDSIRDHSFDDRLEDARARAYAMGAQTGGMPEEQFNKLIDLLVDIAKELRTENKVLHRHIEILEQEKGAYGGTSDSANHGASL